MKNAILALCCSPALAFSEELDLPSGFIVDPSRPEVPHLVSASRKYFDGKRELQRIYRQHIASIFEHVDGVELFLLHFDPNSPKDVPRGEAKNFFLIAPYSAYAEILGRKKVLDKKLLLQFKDAASKLLRAPELQGPMGHYPSHGIRLLRGDDVIFETSFSRWTSNYFIRYPDSYPNGSWVGIGETEIEKLLNEQLPIPNDVIEQYQKKYDPHQMRNESRKRRVNQ